MKNRFRSIAAALLTLALLLSCAVPSALAGDEVSVEVSAKFLYDEARSMLGLSNDFRTGDEAYYLDKDNQTRVSAAGLKDTSASSRQAALPFL